MFAAPFIAVGSARLHVLAASGAAVVVCVVLHFLVLEAVIRLLRRRKWRPVVAINGTVLTLIAAHLAEIAVFAVTHALLLAVHGHGIGDLAGDYDGSLTDKAYFSAAVYTTVGFGDITPTGEVRWLVGIEALTGLVLITWSASFTFLVMQRVWERKVEDAPGLFHSENLDRPEN